MSPCIGVCTLDTQRDFCVGCFRTSDEITNWIQLSYIEKERIISECKIRKMENKNGCEI